MDWDKFKLPELTDEDVQEIEREHEIEIKAIANILNSIVFLMTQADLDPVLELKCFAEKIDEQQKAIKEKEKQKLKLLKKEG